MNNPLDDIAKQAAAMAEAQATGQQKIMLEVFFMPQPCNTIFEVEQVPGSDLIRMIAHTPNGVTYLWLGPEAADQLSNQLKTLARAASAARAGIQVVRNASVKRPNSG